MAEHKRQIIVQSDGRLDRILFTQMISSDPSGLSFQTSFLLKSYDEKKSSKKFCSYDAISCIDFL